MIPLCSHTRASYVEALFQQFGKGRQHAARLYSRLLQHLPILPLESWVEPQAVALVAQMYAATSLPPVTMTRCHQEGDLVKFLLQFSDQLESESVLIPMESGSTLCISSQVGCKMGCAFCETGKMGLIRSLSAEEIVAQVYWARFVLKRSVRNIVFMGMGEPFDNYDAVMQAVAILTDPAGFAFGVRRITISTSGRVPELLRMAEEAPLGLNLAVSVNAPSDEIRRKIMPVNRDWNMAALKDAMHVYCSRGQREILVEYVLLHQINDSMECAEELAHYLKGLRVKVNLIPYNAQTKGRFSAPPMAQIESFLAAMRAQGYQTLIRGTKGDQIQAACGQLGNRALRLKLKQIEM